jgi:hypothetical protein
MYWLLKINNACVYVFYNLVKAHNDNEIEGTYFSVGTNAIIDLSLTGRYPIKFIHSVYNTRDEALTAAKKIVNFDEKNDRSKEVIALALSMLNNDKSL